MQSRDTEYFSTIIQTGSITKAAELLHISQPSLSQYLMRFETRLGAPLFDRSTTPWRLTDVGKCYSNYINEFNQLDTHLKNDIQSILNGQIEKQSILMGIPPWKGALILPHILSQYADKYPNVAIDVLEDSSLELAGRVQSGEITFAVMNTPFYDRHLIYEKLGDERILLAVNKEHPLAKGRVTSMENPAYFDITTIYNERIIIPGPNQTITKEVQNLFAKHKMRPARQMYLNQILTCLNLAALGYGFTFVPELGCDQCKNFEDLAFFTPDDPTLTWSLAIAYNSSQQLNLATKALIDIIKAYFRDYFSKRPR